ncbi:cytochrome P450 307a1 [Tetranychus urticae]|uniref:Cytochrome P450 n=1 Tax=Tetranychus urticae TaxID=32264 RepID=T1KFP7_TETUR|nr:cytochrome P450 307a1 [Tetranychus urticae]
MDFISLSFVYSTLCLAIICVILKKLFQQEPPKFGKYAPSPSKLPIIGHLHLLAKFPDNPWKGFDLIREQYGDVVSLQLGSYNALLVSSLDKMKEVLITKGKIFSDRPDFHRYRIIFGGDRENALALCDWSELQKTRRVLCSISTTPKFASASYEMLDKAIVSELKLFFDFIEASPERILTKCWLRQFSSNVFTEYLCASRMEYNDPILVKLSYFFDFIFNDISQCGPVDFLPFIRHLGFYRGYLKKVDEIAVDLRVFMEKYFVEPRIAKIQKSMELDGEIDLESFDSMISLDLMYKYHLKNPDEFSYEHFLFAIGDLVGGSSAIVNMIMRLVGHLSIDKEVQEDMYQEVAAVAKQHDTDMISLKQRPDLPLIEAAILEALRISSSPLVPHVPTEDSTIGGYFVPKGTIVLFNNYNMNFSTEFYTDPEEFQPSRFLSHSSNNNSQSKWQIKKPEVFLPFSVGQRSCLGFKLTQYITFVALCNILLRYKIEPVDSIETIKNHIRGGVLALRVDDVFRVKLIPRD